MGIKQVGHGLGGDWVTGRALGTQQVRSGLKRGQEDRARRDWAAGLIRRFASKQVASLSGGRVSGAGKRR